MSKRCDECGGGYYRRNLAEAWDQRAPGKRSGWHKTIRRVCNRCLGLKQVLRLLVLTGASPLLRAAKRQRRKP